MLSGRFKIVSYAVAIGGLGLLIYGVGTAEVVQSLRQVTVGGIMALLSVSVALILVSVIKWRGFLGLFAPAPSVWRLFELYLVGYFVNLFLPSQVGGDVVRSLSISEPGDRARTFVCTFLERFTGLLAMVLIACGGLLVTTQPTLVVGLVVLLTLVVWGGAIALWMGVPAEWIPWRRLARAVEQMEEALASVRRAPGTLMQAFGLSVAFHCLTVVNTQVASWVVGGPWIGFGDLFVVVPLILLLGSVPVTPSGIGVQEGVWVFFLGQVGVSPADSLVISLILRAKSYILGAFGGMVVIKDRMVVADGPSV